MARSALVHRDLDFRPARGERARATGVIEVNVGQRDQARDEAIEPVEQCLDARGGTRIDQHVTGEPGADDAWATEVADVDRTYLGGGHRQAKPTIQLR